MYYLLLIFLYPLALLPLPVLYFISDGGYFIVYHVLGYRKDIVLDNLRNAFPAKSDDELYQIRKRFYKSFCDQWIETIKLLSISKEELNRRFSGNWEVFRQLGAEGKNTYAILGHNFNWEWANVACQYNTPQQYACIYLPVESSAFNRMMLRVRSGSGAWMVSMKALKSGLSRLKDVQHILALAADQNPSAPEVAEWISFMNREAPFFRGPEQMARRAKAAVVFAGIRKIKRGYYKINLLRYCDDASLTTAGDILKAYVSFVESQIRAQPENWLWTHKRWKHSKPVAVSEKAG